MPAPSNNDDTGFKTEVFTEYAFTGMDATTNPETLPSGTLQSLVNGMVVGAAPGGAGGGRIQTRPGKRAQLAAALSGAIARCVRFRKPDGTRVLILAVADSTSTTGHLYQWVKGATTCTQLSAASLFNSYSVQFTQLGSYLFVIGAVDGNVYRFDLSGNTDNGSPLGYATGELTPTSAATVALTNVVLDTGTAGANWVIDHLSGSPTDVINPTFTGGGNFPPGYSGWTKLPGSIIECVQAFPGSLTWYVRLDDQPSSIQSVNGSGVAALANNTLANSYYTGGSLPTRYATHFKFSATYYTDSGGAQDAVTITVIVYSDNAGATEIARQSFVFTPATTGANVLLNHIFDFSFLDPTQPQTYSVILGPGPRNRPGSFGPYLTNISCQPYIPSPASVAAGTGAQAADTLVYLPNGQNSTDEKTILSVGNQRFSHDLGSSLDLSGYQALVFTFTETSPLVNVRARLALRTATTDAGTLTDVMTLSQDNTGALFLYVDITAIPAGDRNAVRYFDVLFLSDISLQSGYTNSGQPFAFGPLTNAGGKSLDLPYFVRFTESVATASIGAFTPASMIESGGSPLSTEIDTDGLHQTLAITLPARTNSNADAYGLYLEGGTFDDGYFRLESRVPVATGVTNWPNLTWNGGTGTYTGTGAYSGITWNPTSRVYTTSIPDSALELATFLYDHQPPPSLSTVGVAPQAIATYNDRLLIAAGHILYVSAETTGVSAGLYWNFVPIATDPNYSTQGTSINVGALEGTTSGDAINRIRIYQSRAVCFYENHVFIFSGLNNTDFAVREFQPEKNIGLLAPNAAEVLNNGLMFLSSNGLHAFNLTDVNRDIAQPIARLLNPAAEFAGAALSAAAYANCSLIAHAGRLLLSAPTSTSGSAIAATYVLDTRIGGRWYEWDLGAVLCGESFAGSGDTDDLVVGCADGMLYSLGNAYGDTATSSGSPAAVTLYVKTRAYLGGLYDLYAMRFAATWNCADASPAPTFGVYNLDNPAAQAWNLTYTGAAGEGKIQPPAKVSSAVRGRSLYADMSVSTVQPFVLQKMELVAGAGRRN